MSIRKAEKVPEPPLLEGKPECPQWLNRDEKSCWKFLTYLTFFAYEVNQRSLFTPIWFTVRRAAQKQIFMEALSEEYQEKMLNWHDSLEPREEDDYCSRKSGII